MSIEDTEEDEKIVPFQTVRGGKTLGGNWLMNLPVNTIFITLPKKTDNPVTVCYQIVYKFRRAVKLEDVDDDKEYMVDSVTFSRVMELVEILDD
jgi:hypothetical protein